MKELLSMALLMRGLDLVEGSSAASAPSTSANTTGLRPQFPIVKVTFDHVASVFGICLWILLGILAKIGSIVALVFTSFTSMSPSVSSITSFDEEIPWKLSSDHLGYRCGCPSLCDASRGRETYLHSQQRYLLLISTTAHRTRNRLFPSETRVFRQHRNDTSVGCLEQVVQHHVHRTDRLGVWQDNTLRRDHLYLNWMLAARFFHYCCRSHRLSWPPSWKSEWTILCTSSSSVNHCSTMPFLS